MRTLLLGTDLSYNKNGLLTPIELNTNLGINKLTTLEFDKVFDLSPLSQFISQNSFTKLTYIGAVIPFNTKLKNLCDSLNIEYTFIEMGNNITIPFVEDSETHLIIRSAYDVTAVVDESYCKDKIGFLNLIKNSSFSSQFAYKDENGNIISTITGTTDNGVHPNFILKARYPIYDRNLYPKFFKVENQEQLNFIIENYVDYDHFLMEYYFNPDKLENNTIVTIRSYNLLYPPDLKSIPIGSYKKRGNMLISENVEYNPTTFEVLSAFRGSYLSGSQSISIPKLLDTDLVMMADGTYKTGLDLQAGDIIKTIKLYDAQPLINEGPEVKDYSNDWNSFINNVTFHTNKVLGKKKSNVSSPMVTITFSDGSQWMDTNVSRYLVRRNDLVIFVTLGSGLELSEEKTLKVGDVILLISTEDLETINIVQKTVVSIVESVEFFDGWTITVEEQHLFLSKSPESDGFFVAIEHNTLCATCFQLGYGLGGCDKVYEACQILGDNSAPCFGPIGAMKCVNI